LAMGFGRCKSDPCLYILKREVRVLLLLVYVDDILAASSHEEPFREILAGLRREYDVTESGDVSWLLGWHAAQFDSGLFVSQLSFTLSLLRKFGMECAKPVATPGAVSPSGAISQSSPRSKSSVPSVFASSPSSDVVEFTPTKYREVVGSLLFLTNCTRPDIAFATNVACRAMSSPSEDDWIAVKRILRYLAGTPALGLWFKKTSSESSSMPFLHCFSDSDWAGDVKGRKSTSGFACYVGGSLVSWGSRKQSIVALSTMEAEYVALASAVREMLSLRSLLSELGFSSDGAVVYTDNTPAKFLAENHIVTQRSKHIDLRYHFLQDVHSRSLIKFEWVPSNQQKADIFTKFLAREPFQRLRACLVGEGA
ncbi:MAG: hypothetical protein GY721_07415, partial [Deltaproteobacteria bacterium]|nr:hypothetical protein [Deltaproteobacteria bacterium]